MAILPNGTASTTQLHNQIGSADNSSETCPMTTPMFCGAAPPRPRSESAIITMAGAADSVVDMHDAPIDPLKSAKIKKQAWVLNKLKMPSRGSVSPLVIARNDAAHNVARSANEKSSELQAILTQQTDTGVCFLRDSPFRILRAAEAGNLDEFVRLYQGNNARLTVQDTKGRTAAHQAAARNRVNILLYIKEQNGNLDMQDLAGNTPLHKAVEHDALDALECLLQLCVNTGVLNEKKLAPVHLATEMNRVEALKIMGRHRQIIDIQKGGEHGRTALHLAAIHDHEECARILITEFDACPRRPCNNGYYPIHEAAKNASSRTMEVFFQWGESRGCTREEMISFYDAEGNVPLHSAVHGGDIKAVELCINSGAKISTQQHDLSTPVHLACAQGAMDIVKLMFSMQPAEKRVCLSCVDAQKMTPLHCASMFDHPEIVEYLVAEGAEINALDREGRSPLLLAASRAGWKTVNVMIRQGANIGVKDCNHRNVLHLVIMNGGRLHDFAEEVTKAQSHPVLLQLLNEKDHTGCSPLHYASREGHIRSLENLIRLGACINLKNNNNESPLHFAARYGRYNTVRQLLDSEKGSFIINESDGGGLTPLHIASQQGHTRVVQLLLNRGALLHRDHNGRNPLHLAAMSGYTQTIELLHSVHSHLLDHQDKDGNTPLHLATMENKSNAIALLLSIGCKLTYNYMTMSAIDYAIHYKYQEAALAMVTHDERSGEVMNLRSGKHPCVTLALIASMPRVFEAVQDKCITRANCKKDSKSFYISYSFSCLQCEVDEVDEKTGEKIQLATKPLPLPALNIKYAFHAYQKSAADIRMLREKDPQFVATPLCVVNAMVSHGRVELLAHPLSQKYLQMKWNSYGKYYHVANLLIYCVFLAFVTLYSSLLMHSVINSESTPAAATDMPMSTMAPTVGATVNRTQPQAAVLAHPAAELLPDAVTETLAHAIRTAALTSHASRHNYDAQPMPDGDAMKKTHHPPIAVCTAMIVCAVAIMAYTAINVLRELFQVYQQKWHYLIEMNSLVSWCLYVSATLMVAPVLNGGRLDDMHFSAASVTVFLSWFNLLLFLQRFDQVGIYVVMFLEILQTLIKVLAVFSILIIAFGLSFFILMSKANNQQSTSSTSFQSIPMSLVRTFSMMLGEMDFVGTYVQPYYNDQLTFPIPAFILLCLFMVLMPILLMNLLIGLAVGDIESVRRNAQLKRLAMQVVLHSKLEQKLPQVWLERVDKMELIEYPNTNKCKVGIFDFILRKWFCNPFTDDNSDMLIDTNEDYLGEELDKQRRKLKEISCVMEQQHQMLRLIIQKMEIRTEADDVDEGVSPHELKSPLGQLGGGAGGGAGGSGVGSARWTSPKIRKRLKHAMSFTKN